MRAGSPTDATLCFTRRSPSTFLNGFDCMSSEYKGAGSLVCFRDFRFDDVAEYKEHYNDRYAEKVAKYLDSAAKCPVSNGDSTIAPRTLLPPQLGLIARYAFGYVLSLGSGVKTDSYILHGVATLDPSISGDSKAIEFVSILVGGVTPAARKQTDATGESVGEYRLSIDDSSDYTEQMVRFIKRQSGLTSFVDARFFDIRKPLSELPDQDDTRFDDDSRNDASRKKLLFKWRNAIIEWLQDKDFDRVSDRKMKEATGNTIQQAQRNVLEHSPYAFRENQSALIGRPYIFTTSVPSCTENDDGAIIAMIMTMAPEKHVGDNFGSIAFVLIGVGECGHRYSSTRRFADRTETGVITSLKNSMEAK